MNNLYTVSEIRTIEEKLLYSLPFGSLMQKAAAKLATWVKNNLTPPSRILILVGTGNNGGDALLMATLLPQYPITILQTSLPKAPEAILAYEKARSSSHIHWESQLKNIQNQKWDLIVDGLLGIGISRALSPELSEIVSWTNQSHLPILAIDTPTGLNTDTGHVYNVAIKATHTITFLGNKPGFYTKNGRDYVGELILETLDCDDFTSSYQLNHPLLFPLLKRKHNSHKGSFGRVAIVGGDNGLTGAPLLAARAALQSGAGLTYISYVGTPLSIDFLQPELMHRSAFSFDYAAKILVIGPGLGTSEKALELLSSLLIHPQPIVLDADALNLIATHHLEEKVSKREFPTIITPHPLEAARLLDENVPLIQENRLNAAKKLSKKLNAITILKGSGSIISSENGKCFVNPTGNPALATAGTGDVLAGLCGSLLGQNLPPLKAALAATWLHGKAADVCVSEGLGPIGLTASEIISKVRFLINQLAQ